MIRKIRSIIRDLQELAFVGSAAQYARFNDAANRLATAIGIRNARYAIAKRYRKARRPRKPAGSDAK